MLKTAKKSLSLQKSSIIYAILMAVGSLANYLLYPLLQRNLFPSDFNQIAASLALYGQVSGLLIAFNVLSLVATKNNQESTPLITKDNKVIFSSLLVLCLLFAASYPLLAKKLELTGYLPLLLIGSLVIMSIPSLISVGNLQASQRIIASSFYTLSASLSKLILVVILSKRYGLPGSIWGIVIGQFIGMVSISFIANNKKLGKGKPYRNNANYAQLLYLVAICAVIGFLQNADTILGRNLLVGDYQYKYIIVSSLSNVGYFGVSVLTWIYLSKMSFNRTKADYELAMKSILNIFLIILAGLVLISIIGEKIIFMVSGVRIDKVQLVFNLSYQSMLGVIGFISYWLYSYDSKKILYSLITPIVIFSGLFLTNQHASGSKIVAILFVLSATQFVSLMVLSLRIRKNQDDI